jgi:hypothetical protein
MIFDSVWTYDKLWAKSKFYIQKAFAEDRESETFSLWAAIALEFVARATLARVHPVLLADPREGEHILYAFGYQKKVEYTPISIPTKSVLERCAVVVPNFTENERKFCKAITNRRNEELHSGGIGFDGFHPKKWLSKYYKTLKILLEFQGKNLIDLLGKEEAGAAEEMIKERDSELEKEVKDRISLHIKEFRSLSPEMQEERVANSKIAKYSATRPYKKDEQCPACGNIGILSGKLISVSDGKAGEDAIEQDFNVLPTGFECFCCGLQLSNHLELDVVEMGGQYKITEVYSPREYFDIPVDEPDFDYGND